MAKDPLHDKLSKLESLDAISEEFIRAIEELHKGCEGISEEEWQQRLEAFDKRYPRSRPVHHVQDMEASLVNLRASLDAMPKGVVADGFEKIYSLQQQMVEVMRARADGSDASAGEAATMQHLFEQMMAVQQGISDVMDAEIMKSMSPAQREHFHARMAELRKARDD